MEGTHYEAALLHQHHVFEAPNGDELRLQTLTSSQGADPVVSFTFQPLYPQE
jgi:hypothetical protein